MKYPLLFALTLSIACQSYQETKTVSNDNPSDSSHNSPSPTLSDDSASPSVSHRAVTFYDSVLQKLSLSFAQIRTHTTIDSIYYTGDYYSQSTFTGDTIYILRNNFKGVVIIHSGPNCLKKLLLIYNVDNNELSHETISEGCDSDGEDRDYSSTDYKMINDSTFIMIETIIPANAEEKHLPNKKVITKWRITSGGKICQTTLGKG